MTDANLSPPSAQKPPSFWQSIREFGVVPLFFASLIGIGSTTEIIQFFFGDVIFSDLLRNWLETWRYLNDKLYVILSPVADVFLWALSWMKIELRLDPIWVNFFWLFLLPGISGVRLFSFIINRSLGGERLVLPFFFLMYGIFALLLALVAGLFPSKPDPMVQMQTALAPLVAIPIAGLIATSPFVVLVILIELYTKRSLTRALKAAGGFVWVMLPGKKYFKLLRQGIIGAVIPTGVLAWFEQPAQGQALFVYYFWLLVLGVFMLLRAPTPNKSTDRHPRQRAFFDSRPMGMFILGGLFFTVLVVVLDRAIA